MRKDILPYYRVLGISPGAGPNEIRRAYRQLVQQWHPDLFKPGSPMQTTAEDMTKDINEAYGQLYRKKLYRQYPPPDEAKAEEEVSPRPARSRPARSKPPERPPEPAKPKPPRWIRFRDRCRHWSRRRSVRWSAGGAVLATLICSLWAWWPEHLSIGRPEAVPASSSPTPTPAPVVASYRAPTTAPTPAAAVAEALPPTAAPATLSVVARAEQQRTVAEPASQPRHWPSVVDMLSLATLPEDHRSRTDPVAVEETDKLAGTDKLIIELFEPGDSKARVKAVQGPPDEEGNYLLRYGSSLVYFRDGRVRGWVDREPRLRVRWWDDTVMPTMDRFSTGSSRNEVERAQGRTNTFATDRYLYGSSEVLFSHGRVSGWISGDVPLRVFDFPALPRSSPDPGPSVRQ